MTLRDHESERAENKLKRELEQLEASKQASASERKTRIVIIGAAGMVLTACALALLLLHWEVLLVASWAGVLALMALVAMALAIGHGLGGPDEDDRTAH